MREGRDHASMMEPIVDHQDEEGNYMPRDFADWREIPSETLERNEVREKLAEALASLGEKYREVFVLRDMQHLSIEETAKALEISRASVKTRLLRARLMLRDLLSPGLGGSLEQQVVVRKGDQAMVVNCEEVWREISNYLDGESRCRICALPWMSTSAGAGAAPRCWTARVMSFSFTATSAWSKCRWDSAIVCSDRLEEKNMPAAGEAFFGWMVAAAAASLGCGQLRGGAGLRFSQPELRSEHAQPGTGVPPDMMVVVSTDGKTFHAAGCPFIHDKAHIRTIAAREAVRQGYVPCVRCMKKYLTA